MTDARSTTKHCDECGADIPDDAEHGEGCHVFEHGTIVCPTCFDQFYARCADCNEVFDKSDLDGDGYCDQCAVVD